ncbi:hypothetical protein PBRA_009394 [Plasmodiophora brassicae]|uniref:t-SNARE coiled-coil homology domain-containing protein n=1 Tax=Plasmodiophora brassicae TaxID=37360 RepID=A0A0G4J7Z2_PLABS|nr:hypothetical protein PBRA_009394 [Plasmodiophora brassicae]
MSLSYGAGSRTSAMHCGAVDRTDEFFATADSFRKQGSAPQTPAAAAPLPGPASAVQFNTAATQVSRMINNTTAKLENLARIAQTRTLFNDPGEQIAQLTSVIKADLGTISNEIDLLSRFGAEHQTGNRHVDSHTNGIIKDLQSRVAEQTRQFHDVLKIRSANMKEQDSRKERYTKRAAPSASTSSHGLRHRPGMIFACLRCSRLLPFRSHKMTSAAKDMFQESASASTAIDIDLEQQQALLPQASSGADAYLDSRASAISTIETTMQELGEMYQRLAVLVAGQGEQLERIDDNIGRTLDNTSAAHEQLEIYWQRMKSNRGLIIKVFLALIIFAIIFIGVIA